MILTEQAISAIKESKDCRRELIYQMDISHQSLYRWLISNNPNNTLTTIKAISIIKEFTGLTQDQLLMDENMAMELNESDVQKN